MTFIKNGQILNGKGHELLIKRDRPQNQNYIILNEKKKIPMTKDKVKTYCDVDELQLLRKNTKKSSPNL